MLFNADTRQNFTFEEVKTSYRNLTEQRNSNKCPPLTFYRKIKQSPLAVHTCMYASFVKRVPRGWIFVAFNLRLWNEKLFSLIGK